MSYVHPVILSGGVGSRLWPLSRSQSPKQLLALAGEQTLIQQTAIRVSGPGFAKPSIICHAEHRFAIAHQMQEIRVVPENIFLEPLGRNTAPAAAVSAVAISEMEPDAVLLVMPADHVIRDQKAFFKAVDAAHAVAKRGCLVTFGIAPREANTGYGYIQRGAPLNGLGGVSRFRALWKNPPQKRRPGMSRRATITGTAAFSCLRLAPTSPNWKDGSRISWSNAVMPYIPADVI